MSKVTEGYDRYLKYSNDPNFDRNSVFYIFDSILVWNKEGATDLPKNDIILKELERNRFLAHP